MLIYADTRMIKLPEMTYPVYLADFYAANPNVMRSEWFNEEAMTSHDFYPVLDTPLPEGDVKIEGDPVYNPETKYWYRTWTTRPFTEEEIAQNLADAKLKAKYAAENVMTTDLFSDNGVHIVDDIYYRLYASEHYNLMAVAEYAKKNMDKNIVLVDVNRVPRSYPAAEALEMIDLIITTMGAVHQRYANFILEVDSVTNIESIPEVPSTFIR